MYLSSLSIKNFRKFRECNNIVSFVSGIEPHEIKNNSIANNTTLIVGKNNAGKTTIIRALEKLTIEKFNARDFNLDYLEEWRKDYIKCNSEDMDALELPLMEFRIVVGLDKSKGDYINNLSSFTPISSIEAKKEFVDIVVRFMVVEKVVCIQALQAYDFTGNTGLLELLDFIDKNINLWGVRYFSPDGRLIGSFKLGKLIELVSISAIHIATDKSLTEEFNRILTYRLNQQSLENTEEIDASIKTLNDRLDEKLCKSETRTINGICKDIMTNDVSVDLRSNITKEKLINSSMMLYQYSEGKKLIPEDQFGLGYSNIVMIIAQVIEYIDKNSTRDASSKINIICIEEPETHMHPQMQEMFIRNIDKAIKTILDSASDRYINSQLIITTHSPHILNSKINDGGSFDNIDFVVSQDDSAKVLQLNDIGIAGLSKSDIKDEKKIDMGPDFTFIKKHMTLGMSEIFFSDAAILVEGPSEYKLIPYILQNRKEYSSLKSHYVSVIDIGGAFAGKYRKILSDIGIPVAIITDLDIKKTQEEKDENLQIHDLNNRESTNVTLHDLLGLENSGSEGNGAKYKLDPDRLKSNEIGNIGVFTGTSMQDVYPTSLEEALYLANCTVNGNIISEILKKLHPDINKQFPSTEIGYSAKWQSAISDDKGIYSTMLLYELITNEDYAAKFVVPEYIDKALRFIMNKLDESHQESGTNVE